ncbi:DUF2963 domain-containing protein [Candidatus Phytoplasma solani]|uniref:DUF2963 domain-containing protein n=1 Tax=Candidatus Phytoplasma solani TaxID=69896 RepID=A0A421NXG1_9MOLU|nr:DUF2963 domain-containing protein [Candidatus Phytoplasma solani]RMI88713.1 hypothetical protein PSSA1_v1c3090 [Candidatus Phytoplasma solani]
MYTKTIWFIKEYDKITHKLIKKTYYQDDGKTVNLVREYDKNTGELKEKWKSMEFEKPVIINYNYLKKLQDNKK